MKYFWTISKWFHRPYNWLFWFSWTVPLAWIDDLTATASNWVVSLTRTDPNDVVKWWKTITSRTATKIVRKEWTAPTDSTDWDLILTETTKNQYSSTAFDDDTIETSWTYYYVAFAVADNWLETISNVEEVAVVVANYKTYTIVRNEVSDPAQFFVKYDDDATWKTRWSTDFDDFFWYSAVLLDASWNEVEEVQQSNWNLNLSSFQWALSWANNVMIKFPRRWIKMTKDWTQVSLSITNDPNKTWFQYYAHSRWTFSSPIAKDNFYLWAYLWFKNDSNVLKSRSWQTPSASDTQANFITYARNNDSNTWNVWYDIVWFYQRMYVEALYMMKYWNPDSQTTVWNGVWAWSWPLTTWWTNSQQSATYWDSSQTVQIKLFWIEDFRWNLEQNIWWVCTDWSYEIKTMLSWFTWTATGDFTSTWAIVPRYNEITWIAWTNMAMFTPISAVSNSNYDTYYCDYVMSATSRIATAWWWYDASSWPWTWWKSLKMWIFNFYPTYLNWKTWTFIWSRLMYL